MAGAVMPEKSLSREPNIPVERGCPGVGLRVLFLCTGNSCRSQMCEGWARALKRGAVEAYSAGTDPQGLNRLAVRAMAEVGVDISGQVPKLIDELRHLTFDLLVTVCDSARQACPHFPGATKSVHVGFDDPPRLAAGAKSDDEAMPHYRRVRDEIRRFVETLPDGVPSFMARSQDGRDDML